MDETTNDELWRRMLTGEKSSLHAQRRRHRHLPGSPRCKTCLYPLAGGVARVLHLATGRGPSVKNPNYCNICELFVKKHPGGAEIELSLLFADVRGSTAMGEPYMLWIHQRPFDGGDWPAARLHVVSPWRAPGVPRYVAAGELGSGVYFNPVRPETAARSLRRALTDRGARPRGRGRASPGASRRR